FNDTARGVTAFLDYMPTRELRVTVESGRESDTLEGSAFAVGTNAIHITASVLRSASVTLDAGEQTQRIRSDASSAQRRFANLASTLQLWPTLRMLISGTYQKTNSQSSDPSVQLLGAPKDERITDEVIWRPSRELSVGVRVGWVSGQQLSGFSERLHVDWFPFADGTVSLGGSYDDDIDPTLNRRARRLTFSPRWVMNRHAAIDVNYTAVSSAIDASADR